MMPDEYPLLRQEIFRERCLLGLKFGLLVSMGTGLLALLVTAYCQAAKEFLIVIPSIGILFTSLLAIPIHLTMLKIKRLHLKERPHENESYYLGSRQIDDGKLLNWFTKGDGINLVGFIATYGTIMSFVVIWVVLLAKFLGQ